MNNKFSFNQIQTMDDVEKVDFKLCQTEYEMLQSKDFFIAFEKILRLMKTLSEEEIQDLLRIFTKIKSSEELLYKEGVRFNNLLDSPIFQKTGTKFIGHLVRKMKEFLASFYGKDWNDTYISNTFEKNISTQRMAIAIKAAIEQTLLTPPQMKSLAPFAYIKDIENIGWIYSNCYMKGVVCIDVKENPLSDIAKEKGDYVEFFEYIHQTGKGKLIVNGDSLYNTLTYAASASNKKIVRYLLENIT